MKYTVIKPENVPGSSCGFCGFIWQAIRAIYHNPNEEYYFDFSNSHYQTTPGADNIWDHYYEQPFTTVKPQENEIKKTVGIIFDPESNFIHEEMVPQTPENIQAKRQIFNKIYTQHFKLKKEIQDRIDSFYDNNMRGKKVLGVHFRGTDHPNRQNMDKSLQVIKNNIIQYDRLLICSDEFFRYKIAAVAFKHKAIAYNSIRSDSSAPLHHNVSASNQNAEYFKKITEDIIIEATLMSKTDFLVCCPGSNVNFLSRAINPNLNSYTIHE